jgi:16S rRNA (cytosine1402-N4)-methyltransferase
VLASWALALLLASPSLRLVGVERDREALAFARERLAPFGERVVLVEGRHEELAHTSTTLIPQVWIWPHPSAVSADTLERGFSFRNDGPLDYADERPDPLPPMRSASDGEPPDFPGVRGKRMADGSPRSCRSGRRP